MVGDDGARHDHAGESHVVPATHTLVQQQPAHEEGDRRVEGEQHARDVRSDAPQALQIDPETDHRSPSRPRARGARTSRDGPPVVALEPSDIGSVTNAAIDIDTASPSKPFVEPPTRLEQ